MQVFNKFKNLTLIQRLSVFVIGILVIVWTTLISTVVYNFNNHSETEIVKLGTVLANDLSKASYSYMMNYDYYGLRFDVKNLQYVDELYYAAVYDDNGRLIAYYPKYDHKIYAEIDKHSNLEKSNTDVSQSRTHSDRVGSTFIFSKNVSHRETGEVKGKVVVALSKQIAQQSIQSIISFILLTGVLLLAFILVLLSSFFKRLLKPLVNLTEKCKQYPNVDFSRGYGEHDLNSPEISTLVDSFKKLSSKITNQEQIISNHAKEKALIEIAAQVAHDIRSPLAALNVVTRELPEVSEEKRLLIQQAVQRIDDIANDLGSKKSEAQEQETPNSKISDSYLISAVLDSIISEKRTQFRSHLNVDIRTNIDSDSYGLFCKINIVEFKRIVSNLINNSVEAFGSKEGQIIVSLIPASDETISVTVEDNGKGIPQDVICKITERGFSSGKKSGSGLGLFHAKRCLEKWNGSLEISSEENVGTKITLTLPKEKAPNWFVPKLRLMNNQTLVVVDDDQSIHKIWEGRLLGLKNEIGLKIKNFSMPDHAEKWILENSNKGHLYLFDYEFLGSKINGLDVIERLGIHKQAVLITSRYEQVDVRKRCAKLGVKLIPKTLAGYVPIETKTAQQKDFDCVLIDDESMVRSMWEMVAKQNGKSIKTYSDPDEFYSDIDLFNKETPIYIDSNLQNNIKGEEVSKDIQEKGFHTIYLATGYHKDTFTNPMPWIKDIVGKEPPWKS